MQRVIVMTLLLDVGHGDLGRWESFRRFVSQSAHIMKYVKHFKIIETRDGEDDPDWPIDFSEVVELLPHFPNLSELYLLTKLLSFPWLPSLPAVTEALNIRKVTLVDDETMEIESRCALGYLLRFRNSHEISLRQFSLYHALSTDVELPSYRNLRQLSLRSIYGVHFLVPPLRRVLSADGLPALEAFEIGYVSLRERTLDEVNTLLLDLPSRITYLGVQYHYDEADVCTFPVFALCRLLLTAAFCGLVSLIIPRPLPFLHRLDTLRFVFSGCFNEDGRKAALWVHAISALPSQPTQSLANIVFEHGAVLSNLEDTRGVNLSTTVEQRLLELPGLKQVTFEARLNDQTLLSLPKQSFAEAFPQLHQRNQLTVL